MVMMTRKKRGRRVAILSKAQMLARVKAIIADIRAGVLSYRDIAAKHGVSLPTVNNKARKAGISRGRRKGAKILVPAPRRRRAGTAAKAAAPRAAGTRRKAGRKPGRPKGSKTGARAAGRPAGRKAARRAIAAVPAPAAPAPRKRARRGVRRKAGRPRGAAAPRTGFLDAMRAVVLQYHPNMSLRAYERLVKSVQAAVA